MNPQQQFTNALQQAFAEGSFVRLSLGHYRGPEPQLEKLLARIILVKKSKNAA